ALAEPPNSRQAREQLLGRTLVAGRLERATLLARPFEPARAAQAFLQRVRHRQQVLDVGARVLGLLGRQRPAVPATEAFCALPRDPEQRAHERVVAGLRAVAREAGGDLCVEDV